MTLDEFLVYVEDYNANDPARLSGHYAPGIIFENYGGYHKGPEVLEFLGWLTTVAVARMAPRLIMVQADHIALEADMFVTGLADLPDLPIGSLMKGECKVSRTFAFYDTDGPLIRHIRLAGWPPVAL